MGTIGKQMIRRSEMYKQDVSAAAEHLRELLHFPNAGFEVAQDTCNLVNGMQRIECMCPLGKTRSRKYYYVHRWQVPEVEIYEFRHWPHRLSHVSEHDVSFVQ